MREARQYQVEVGYSDCYSIPRSPLLSHRCQQPTRRGDNVCPSVFPSILKVRHHYDLGSIQSSRRFYFQLTRFRKCYRPPLETYPWSSLHAKRHPRSDARNGYYDPMKCRSSICVPTEHTVNKTYSTKVLSLVTKPRLSNTSPAPPTRPHRSTPDSRWP